VKYAGPEMFKHFVIDSVYKGYVTKSLKESLDFQTFKLPNRGGSRGMANTFEGVQSVYEKIILFTLLRSSLPYL